MVPLAFGITFIGMGASSLFPQISPEQAFPVVIKEVLPPFLGGIVLAALLGAVMSSADTVLLTASTILTVDIIGRFKPFVSQEKTLFYSRWVMVILGGVSLLLALSLKGVINALLFAYTIYTAGLIIPVIAGFYKNRLKITPLGALVAIIGGGSAALISKTLHVSSLELGSLLISILLLFVVSLIDNKHRKKQLDGRQDI
jgi:SSS family solute:Na+ symporter